MRGQKKYWLKFIVKNRPRLLITRFSHHAELLAGELNKINCFAIAQPLLEIEPIEDKLTAIKFINGNYDIVIAVSGNAVGCTQKMINRPWPDAIYLAVGASTQKLLQHMVNNTVFAPEASADSEGLLSLDVLQSIKGKRVLILRGQGGRDLLDKTLVERGATVDFLESYKRIKVDLNGEELVKNWQQASINGAIISSIEILEQLFSLIPNRYLSWLFDLTLYVPSARIAERASIMGVKQVVTLPSLRTEEIVNFFKVNDGN
jgi:uroporphyrinogen-III synthase